MNYPSTAVDYTKHLVSITNFSGYEVNSCTIETSADYALVNVAKHSSMADSVLITYCGKMDFVTVQEKGLITQEGRPL